MATGDYSLGDGDNYIITAPEVVNLCIGPVTINMKTGNVTIAEGVTLDDASKEFWRVLQLAYPPTPGAPR